MAGILQTETLVDGQWTTTNVDVNTVLELHRERKQEDLQIEVDVTPVFGILSQTVIDTPITHWILPARIIRNEIHDVAFIGDKFVQLRRLSNDGRLHDIVRKDDFDSRIRNARVVGSVELETGASRSHVQCTQMKDENGDIHMADFSRANSSQLPPQYIILALESGDLIFLFAHEVNGAVEFVWSCHRATNKVLIDQPVKHLTVDPSSRYMAMGGSEEVFSVYALHSTDILCAQYMRGEPLRPTASEIFLQVDGVIHKMEFLFPSNDDPGHIILLLLVVKNGATGMFVYEWVAGQDLNSIRTNNKRGFKLTEEIRLPLLLIPLRIHSAFLLVSESVMAVCKNLLEGTPEFQDVNMPNDAPSSLYFGIGKPLWTAWARPLRTRSYAKFHDDLYIAREDGVVKSLEIDLEEFLQAKLDVGNFRSNIGTAFASLDWTFPGQDNSASDFLVTGGDSGPGGMYLVEARKPAEFVGVIPNWSPAVDFATTVRNQARSCASQNFFYGIKKEKFPLDEPDRIFACTGRGSHSAISEIRYGHEARIRLDVGPLDVPITESWVLPSDLLCQDNLGSELPSPLLFLLSIVDQSSLLHLSADSKLIEEVEQSHTWLDLSSRTLVAAAYNGLIVQITERSISVSREPILKHYWDSESTVYREDFSGSTAIVSAAIFENELALVVCRDGHGCLEIRGLRIVNRDLSAKAMSSPVVESIGVSFPLSYYPNYVSIVKQSDGMIYGILSSVDQVESSDVKFYPRDTMGIRDMFRYEGNQGFVRIDSLKNYWPVEENSISDVIPEACINFAYLRRQQTSLGQPELLLIGYRNGILTMKHFTTSCEGQPHGIKAMSQYAIGATPVIIKTNPYTPNVAFICCDSKLWRIEYDGISHADPRIDRVWFTDPENTNLLQPAIDHISILPNGLLVANGRKLLVTWFDLQVKPVPRRIPLSGQPTRLLYSQGLDVLIVAVLQNEVPGLIFLDPDTGDELTLCSDKGGNLIKAPLRVGPLGDKILCLAEWQLKDASTEANLIVIGTSGGDLQVHQVEKGSNKQVNSTTDLLKIQHTKYFEGHYDFSIYSIATCTKSLFLGIGTSIWWAELDQQNSKLVTRAEFQLPSRAVSITVDREWLNVMTSEHSLMTFLLVDKKKHPQLGEYHGKLLPQFDDEVGRDGLDQTLLANDDQEDSGKDSAMVIVTDKSCALAGLWYRKATQMLAQDHRTIFEADLPASVLKLRLAKTRPPWDIAWRGIIPNGVLPLSPNTTELFGIGIDGSIRHFTFVREKTCHLLRYLQDLALESRDATWVTPCPYYHSGYRRDPRKRHIDGDILRPYLQGQRLKKLLVKDEGNESGRRVLDTFCKLVQDSCSETASLVVDGTVESYFEEAYRQLETLLRPVL